jgi:hypothetical protein
LLLRPEALLDERQDALMDHWNNVEIEKNGKRHAGKYRVEGGIITVTYDAEGGGHKATQVGNSEPERLAKLMLTELVTELRKGRP